MSKASEPYWKGEWPNLSSISIATGATTDHLSPAELGMLVRLVWSVAARGVNTAYSDAIGDPALPDDDERLARICRCSPSKWQASRSVVMEFFRKDSDGMWRLADPGMVRLSRDTARSAIPVHVRAAALARDGKQCVYCGSEDGPFHFDHLWPVSRGGADKPANVVVACAQCNLSKGDKTLREWMSAK